MKAIQALGWYFPDPAGGTEVYVSALARELRSLGVDSTVAAPRTGEVEAEETFEQAPVYRYPVPDERNLQQQTGQMPHWEFERFTHWLQNQSAPIYHQHSLTYGCGVYHLQAAKAVGKKTILTIHTPSIVCLRGTLMHNGSSVCDGTIKESRCAACWLRSRGLPDIASSALAVLPSALASTLRPLGRAGSALAATSIVHNHRETLHQAFEWADRVVVVCQWLQDAMLCNGVPAEKMLLCRQGVPLPPVNRVRTRRQGDSLVVGFLGRGDPIKGVGVLVDAVRQLPASVDLKLQMHVVESNEQYAQDYMAAVRARANMDSRISLCPPLSPASVPEFLAGIDVLAVPSQWLETGPLVVLEAFAAGIPIIGSDLGGISELVKHGHTGLLVPYSDVGAWANALRRLVEESELRSDLATNIGRVRTMADAAKEMHALYQHLVAA